MNHLKHLVSSISERLTKSPTSQPSLRVISSSHPQVCVGPTDLSDFLGINTEGLEAYRSIIQVDNRGLFIVWISRTKENTPWTFEDALHYAAQFFNTKILSTTFLYAANPETADRKRPQNTLMISIMSLKDDAIESVYLPFLEQRLQDGESAAAGWRSKPPHAIRRNPFVIAAVLVLSSLVFVITISALANHYSPGPDLWMVWDTKGSEGPRYQLQFTVPHPNFTLWAAETHHDDQEWFVRLDDQSMIPSHLIDETERKYQQWFANRYPEVRAIRDSGDYLNSSFYKHPKRHEIKSDRFFHPAHCILALRRYWQAKETGRHVCPRDLDYKHINHCFNILDDFAFVEGKQGTEPVLPEFDDTTLPWLPNACF